MEDNNNQDLNKSFIEFDEREISELNEKMDFVQVDSNFVKDDDEDNQFSGLIPSTNTNKKNEINLSYPSSSNDLNIFDSSDPKYKNRSFFFRILTKTYSEITIDENKKFVEKILYYFKTENGGSRREESLNNFLISPINEIEDDIVISNNTKNNNIINQRYFNKLIIFSPKNIIINNNDSLPLDDDFNLDDSEIRKLDKILKTESDDYLSELKILDKNKHKYIDSKPV
jgi:hypothetical protein